MIKNNKLLSSKIVKIIILLLEMKFIWDKNHEPVFY